ncbi:hypothetical protein CTI12_AA145740 [Artemisia annua]|uniref:Uncharacterized protein n=1 Tax=Artemisia annua TaxID=35608 RepID=A0A2U1PJD3_ARTAN|nr:hypothetical protein CTI12_AA145740 [Artemisia annua]
MAAESEAGSAVGSALERSTNGISSADAPGAPCGVVIFSASNTTDGSADGVGTGINCSFSAETVTISSSAETDLEVSARYNLLLFL